MAEVKCCKATHSPMRIGLLGGAFDTGNMGVSALADDLSVLGMEVNLTIKPEILRMRYFSPATDNVAISAGPVWSLIPLPSKTIEDRAGRCLRWGK